MLCWILNNNNNSKDVRLPVQLQRAMAAEVSEIAAELSIFLLNQLDSCESIIFNCYFSIYRHSLSLFIKAEASREARAKVIAAEGEQKASRALREASEIIGDSPAALQLRYLQVFFLPPFFFFCSHQ